MHKIKLTLAGAALVLSLNAAAAPLPLPNLDLSALMNAGSALFSEEVRLGGFRMSRPASRNFGGSGSSAKSSSSSSSNARSSTNNQQDAQFSRTSPYRNNNTAANNTARPGTAVPPAGTYYTGSPFLSSLTGTMTGMLLAHMLFGSTAQAGQQVEPMTPDRLTDDELKECIDTLDDKLAELEKTRGDILNGSSDTKDADLAQLDKDQQQLKDLKLVLLKEQIARLE